MNKPLFLNAFDMMVPVHQSPGLWRHPESQVTRFDKLDYWTDLARTLENSGFTALFLADVLGVYDVYGGSADQSYTSGVQYPALDPFAAVSAMAANTTRLGFGVTASVTYENPFLLARRLSSLDHMTGGRLAWNIVTSYQDSAARNMGLKAQLPHDERYDRAEEYMEVMYKLFEASIAPSAVRADPNSGVFVDPAGVRPLDHTGQYFSVAGAALAHPGPQRTPLLFQAGASARGQAFALDHAEAIFIIGATPQLAKHWTQQIRDGLEQRGRSRDAIKIIAMATVITGADDEQAQARFASYADYVDTEAALALFGGWTGVDLAGARPDDRLEYIKTDANQSALEAMTTLADATGSPTYTVADLARFVALGGRGPVMVGGPETIADELQRWALEADIDGFNISAAVRPADLERFGRWVSPELRRRGLLAGAETDTHKAHGATGITLREQLFGSEIGAWLPNDHRGASYRH